MTRPKDLGRRDLFRLFRPGGFSLADLYRRRSEAGADRAALPPIRLRPGIAGPDVETTAVGVPELGPQPRRKRTR